MSPDCLHHTLVFCRSQLFVLVRGHWLKGLCGCGARKHLSTMHASHGCACLHSSSKISFFNLKYSHSSESFSATCQSSFYGSHHCGCALRTRWGTRAAWVGPSSFPWSVLSERPWRGGSLWQIYLQSSPVWSWAGYPCVLEECSSALCFPCCCHAQPGSHTEPSALISFYARRSASTSFGQPWHQHWPEDEPEEHKSHTENCGEHFTEAHCCHDRKRNEDQ